MNRTDRLYAIVEELRAVAPRPRSAAWPATHFEVSTRTVERDVSALQQSGVPIWAEPGRTGGYCLDRARTLPPVNLTPEEAVALTVACRQVAGSPFATAAGSALRKLVTAMQEDDAAAASDLAGRVHLLDHGEVPPHTPRPVVDALSTGRALRIDYRARDGVSTHREIEPLGLVGNGTHWFLIAWCRLREGIRAFRPDRITSVVVTSEVPAPRTVRPEELEIPYGDLHPLATP